MTDGRLPSRLVLVGHPVAHSLSPHFQNAALRAAGIPLTYEALDVPPAELSATMRELRDRGAAGNVTIPHKVAVATICERLTPAASRAGAVNTFWVEAGALVGDNTDIDGVALLGAGGSAAAVLCAAERWPGVTVAVFARSRARVESLVRFGSRVRIAASAADAVRGAALVINATPLGLRDADAPPIPVDQLDEDTAVLDLVYSRNETRWVRAARARGLRAADGLTMLLEQGAASFERWLGVAPDRDAMWSAVR